MLVTPRTAAGSQWKASSNSTRGGTTAAAPSWKDYQAGEGQQVRRFGGLELASVCSCCFVSWCEEGRHFKTARQRGVFFLPFVLTAVVRLPV